MTIGANRRRRRTIVSKAKKPAKAKKEQPADWSRVFGQIQQTMQRPAEALPRRRIGPKAGSFFTFWMCTNRWAGNIWFSMLPSRSARRTAIGANRSFKRSRNGKPSNSMTEPDAAIVPLLFGAQSQQSYAYGYRYGYSSGGSRFTLSAARCRAILPLLGRTGRLFARFGYEKDEIQPIAWDDGLPWQFRLQVGSEDGGKTYQVTGWLHRGEERQSIAQPMGAARRTSLFGRIAPPSSTATRARRRG